MTGRKWKRTWGLVLDPCAARPESGYWAAGQPRGCERVREANVAVLGLIVVIRTVLSFSLEIEMEGVPPWRRQATSGANHIARAAKAARARDQ